MVVCLYAESNFYLFVLVTRDSLIHSGLCVFGMLCSSHKNLWFYSRGQGLLRVDSDITSSYRDRLALACLIINFVSLRKFIYE